MVAICMPESRQCLRVSRIVGSFSWTSFSLFQSSQRSVSRDISNVGALIIRIGFWGFLIIIIVEYTPNPLLIIKAPILLRQSSPKSMRPQLSPDPSTSQDFCFTFQNRPLSETDDGALFARFRVEGFLVWVLRV